MHNGNGRPLNKKKQVQLMVVLTILAWATQTLRHQWGFGADVDTAAVTSVNAGDAAPTTSTSDQTDDASAGNETFVPGAVRFAAGATLEMRAEATIFGSDIKLKQICRWSDEDKQVFAPVADFVIARLVNGAAFRSVSIDELKSTLHDAGINLATINIIGAMACTITRSDAHFDEANALQQWIDARQAGVAPATQPTEQPKLAASTPGQPDPWAAEAAQGVKVSTAAAPQAALAMTASATEEKTYHTLAELLTADLAARTGVAVDQMQMSFRAEDEQVLKLAEPSFRFELDPLRARNLGSVSWEVTILSGAEKKRVRIEAEARAWQQQVVLTRPVDSRAVIQAEDYTQRRVLVDSLPSEPLIGADQLQNEQAAESLKPGTVLNSQMVDAVALVKPGQFVTVTVTQGSVQIKSVATAMEAGSYGQSIRVRNEVTRDVFEVTMTGPQAATMNASSTSAGPQ